MEKMEVFFRFILFSHIILEKNKLGGEDHESRKKMVATALVLSLVCPASVGFAKKAPLTIKGNGVLNFLSTNGNGIKCTDSLKLLDATRAVSGPDSTPCGHNEITGKLGLYTKNAKLDIHSDGDSFKTTLDKTDVAVDATLAELGNTESDEGTYTFISEIGMPFVLIHLVSEPDFLKRNHEKCRLYHD